MKAKGTVDRRQLLKTGFVFLGAGCLPARLAAAQAADAPEPHFFLFVNLFPGADSSYLFDARPLAFTAAKKMQNYLGKEPSLWTGGNGGKTLATPLTDPLKEFRANFSVINGVMMSSFDGHDQNQNFLLTGNGLGGESFVPHLNGKASLPLDNVMMTDNTFVTVTNNASTLTSTPTALAGLGQLFASATGFPAGDPTATLVGARLTAVGAGGGSFATGARNMLNGYQSAGPLAGKLKNLQITLPPPVITPSTPATTTATTATATSVATATTPPPPPPVNLQVVGQFFLQGITRSLVIGLAPQNSSLFDTHASGDAAQQPQTFTDTVTSLVQLFRYLQQTPYDQAAGKSLFDVTTVLIGSEFSRTMRQLGAPAIDQTGTDHNPLANSYLLAGKGVKGGQVLGATDLTALDATGNFTNVSGAHTQLDSDLIKLMGMPFDFNTFAPSAAQPATFDNTAFLSFGSVTNTIYQIFGYGTSDAPYVRYSVGGNILPVLKPLIA